MTTNTKVWKMTGGKLGEMSHEQKNLFAQPLIGDQGAKGSLSDSENKRKREGQTRALVRQVWLVWLIRRKRRV